MVRLETHADQNPKIWWKNYYDSIMKHVRHVPLASEFFLGLKHYNGTGFYSTTNSGYTIVFEDDEDAVAFILRWS